MAISGLNRPFKFGEKDRKEFIVEDSEVSLVCINDGTGDPSFLGRAKVGTSLNDNKWQIRKISYDSQKGVTRVVWPQNDNGSASSDYEFTWNSETDLTITNISQDNPGTVTVSDIDNLENGDKIIIQDVEGMTEVNFDGTNIYTVANIAGNDFELQGIDTSAFTAYTDGGTVIFGEFVNYTYS